MNQGLSMSQRKDKALPKEDPRTKAKQDEKEAERLREKHRIATINSL